MSNFLLRCNLYTPGWTAVPRGVKINYDLENSPLQIRTDSDVGSKEKVRVWFYTAQKSVVGGVRIFFSNPPKYKLVHCTSPTNFPTSLPSENDKVWTTTLTRSSGPRVVIHCNDKEVLNVVLTDTVCNDSESDWSAKWSKKVEMIYFHPVHNTAADFYRPGKYKCKRVKVTLFLCVFRRGNRAEK